MELPTPKVEKDQTTLTTVNFGGHTWIVVGTADSMGTSGEGGDQGNPYGNGIKSRKGITLLLEGSECNGFGKTAFGESNSYKDSTLRSALETAANSLSLNEQSVIALRTLTARDDTTNGMAGGDVEDQKFWALSFNEFRQLTGMAAKTNWTDWWLRSTCCGNSAVVYAEGNGMSSQLPPVTGRGIRPAFDLDLDFAVFASSAAAAEGSGKSAAALGNSEDAISWAVNPALISLPTDGSAIKYTFLVPYDEGTGKGIKTPNFTLKPEFELSFTDASHDDNQFISGWIHKTGDEEKNAYAKITRPDEDGKGSFTLSGLTNGTHTISLFGEEANAYKYSDFISNPVVFKVVFNDTITDLTLLSNVSFGLDGGEIILTNKDKDGEELIYTKTWTLGEGGGTIIVGEKDSAEISGNVTDVVDGVDSDGLTKAGAGTLILSSLENDYTSDTTVEEGTLKITGLLGKGEYDGNIEIKKKEEEGVEQGATLKFANNIEGTIQTLTGEITGDGTLVKSGDSTLALTGAGKVDLEDGDITLNEGRLHLRESSSLETGGVFTVKSGAILGLGLDDETSGTDPSVKAASATINEGAILDLVAYDDNDRTTHTLITTTGQISQVFQKVYAGGTFFETDKDSFLFAEQTLSEAKDSLTLALELAWNREEDPHGNFDVTNTFDLGAKLVERDSDNNPIDANKNETYEWDGQTLYKQGEGTLTLLSSENDYSNNRVEAGTLKGNIPEGSNLKLLGTAIYDGRDKDGIKGIAKLRTVGNLDGAADTAINHTDGLIVKGGGTFAGTLDETNVSLTINGVNKAKATEETLETVFTLSGENNAYGDTTIIAGTLSITSDGSLGSGTNTLNGGTLRLAGSEDYYTKAWTLNAEGADKTNTIEVTEETATLKNDNSFLRGGGDEDILFLLNGDGGFTKTGAGTLALSGENTYKGTTFIIDGLIQFDAVNNFGTGTEDIILNGGGLKWTWTFDNSIEISSRLGDIGQDGGTFDITEASSNVTLTALTGTGGITVKAAGGSTGPGPRVSGGTTLTLAGANIYAGATHVDSGTLEVIGTLGAKDAATPTLYTYASGIEINGETTTLKFANTDTNTTQTLTSKITGTGTLVKTGASTLTLTGTVTQEKENINITLDNGRMNIVGGTFSTAGTFSVTGGTLGLTAVAAGTVDASPTLVAGQVVIGDRGRSLGGDGDITLDILSYSGRETYTLIYATNGIIGNFSNLHLFLEGKEIIPLETEYQSVNAEIVRSEKDDSAVLNVTQGLSWELLKYAHGTFDLSDVSDVFDVQTGLADNRISEGYFQFGWDGATLTKDGEGRLTLSGANTYTGDTIVKAGILEITGSLGWEEGGGKKKAVGGGEKEDGGKEEDEGEEAGKNEYTYWGAIKDYTDDTPILKLADTSEKLTTLIFDQKVDQILADEIDAKTASLFKRGTSTQTLTLGASSVLKNVTIESGTLALGADGTLSAQTLTMSAGTTFDYRQATAYGATSPIMTLSAPKESPPPSNFEFKNFDNLTLSGVGATIRPPEVEGVAADFTGATLRYGLDSATNGATFLTVDGDAWIDAFTTFDFFFNAGANLNTV